MLIAVVLLVLVVLIVLLILFVLVVLLVLVGHFLFLLWYPGIHFVKTHFSVRFHFWCGMFRKNIVRGARENIQNAIYGRFRKKNTKYSLKRVCIFFKSVL